VAQKAANSKSARRFEWGYLANAGQTVATEEENMNSIIPTILVVA
jgi:hypothetical protein